MPRDFNSAKTPKFIAEKNMKNQKWLWGTILFFIANYAIDKGYKHFKRIHDLTPPTARVIEFDSFAEITSRHPLEVHIPPDWISGSYTATQIGEDSILKHHELWKKQPAVRQQISMLFTKKSGSDKTPDSIDVIIYSDFPTSIPSSSENHRDYRVNVLAERPGFTHLEYIKQ